MSGVGAQLLSHVVRRGLEQYPTTTEYNFDVTTDEPDYNLELSGWTMAALAAIGVLTVLIIASVDYTVGSVISSLCMIESPSTTTIVEAAPPAYTDEPEPDAPLNKKSGGIELEDVEVLVVANKPVTAHIRTSVKHLHRVGGFFARWRGLLQSIVYTVLLNISGHILGGLFTFIVFHPFVGQALGYMAAVVMLCRVRMLWTHSMIAMPTSARWYKRFVPRKQAKALLLPAAVYAVARQACVFVPMATAYIVGLFSVARHNGPEEFKHMSGGEIALIILRLLAVPASLLVVVLFVYLPAATTLTRIEACLLPENQETIVPFDREAIMGEIDMTERCASKKLFRSAWKSFNNAARIRLVKLYLKLAAFQFAVILVSMHLVVALLYVTSRDQIAKGINTLVM